MGRCHESARDSCEGTRVRSQLGVFSQMGLSNGRGEVEINIGGVVNVRGTREDSRSPSADVRWRAESDCMMVPRRCKPGQEEVEAEAASQDVLCNIEVETSEVTEPRPDWQIPELRKVLGAKAWFSSDQSAPPS